MLGKLSIFISFLLFFTNTKLSYSQALIKLGQEKIKNKNYKEAILILSDAIKKYPKMQNGYYFLAIAYRENDQLTEAEGALLDGIAIEGNINYKLYFELGNMMFKRGKGYYNLAIKYYTNSIKQMPNYDKALLNRANSYVEQGKITNEEKDYKSTWDCYTMALHDYSQFITLKPETEKKNDILYMIKLLRNKKFDLEKLDTNLKDRDKTIQEITKNQQEKSKDNQNNKENKIFENENNNTVNKKDQNNKSKLNPNLKKLDTNLKDKDKTIQEITKNQQEKSKDNQNNKENKIFENENNNTVNKKDQNNKSKFENKSKTNSLIELEKINWQEELNIDE